MIVQDIIDLINEQTRDESITWSVDDVIQSINEGVKNTIQRAPQANSKKELTPCVAGIDQILPVDAVTIINVVANDVDAQGRFGSIIQQADVQVKDAYSPNWRRTRSTAIVIEWMKRSEPTQFLVWPPLDADRNLLIEYSFFPDDVSVVTDTIVITNEFNEAIRNWALYRTFSRDSESTPSVQRAEVYKAQFEAMFR